MKALKFILVLFTITVYAKKPIHRENIDRYCGIYEYIYPDNTPDLIENHFIVISKIDNKLTGLYYGTSDEFDEAREEYLPAFFVSKMDSIEIKEDTLRFILIVHNSDFLTKAVDLRFKSTKEAIKAGYKKWENKISTIPKRYQGVFSDKRTLFFKGEQDFLSKTFKKK